MKMNAVPFDQISVKRCHTDDIPERPTYGYFGTLVHLVVTDNLGRRLSRTCQGEEEANAVIKALVEGRAEIA